MANYLMKYKGKWRLLPEIDENTQDFPKNPDGSVDEDMIYISCQLGNKIWYYGLSDNRRAILGAYIPSTIRGNNIKKAMQKEKIEFFDYDESDEESTFKFKAEDIDAVATLLKARTYGANISPFSSKNLPKSDVELPEEELNKYKAISSKVGTSGMSIIKDANEAFLENVMEKDMRKKLKNKKFSCRDDMKMNKMSRQFKEYVYSRGYFEKYLKYLDSKVEEYYNNK